METADAAPSLHRPGAIHVAGLASKAEAAQICAPRLAISINHVVFDNSLVPGVELLQSVPLRYLGGAYRPDGSLIDESRLFRQLAKGMDCATFPFPQLPEPHAELDQAVFGGSLFPHFGHLMVESTARAWWIFDNDASVPLVLQFQSTLTVVPDFAHRLFELSGMNVHVVAKDTAIRVGNLIIPEPALIERKQAHPKFLRFFDRIRDNVGAGGADAAYGTKLFVTRGKGVAQVFGEDIVATELQRQGYTLLDPTQTSLEDQVKAFAGATEIVGAIGSAMHGVVFASRAKRVAYLVRNAFASPTFPAIDQACGRHEAHYLYVGLTPLPQLGSLGGPYLIDSERACGLLFDAGFLQVKAAPSPAAVIASRDAYMAEWARMANS